MVALVLVSILAKGTGTRECPFDCSETTFPTRGACVLSVPRRFRGLVSYWAI